MEDSISLLGNSQTFVGILATLVILCIARNANNFIYEVLMDIKQEIIEYTKKLKPTVSLDSIKESSDYKSIFLFSENEKHKTTDEELYEVCKTAVSKIDMAKFSLQAKLTNWDESIIAFADAIENKKEQQKGLMFSFAFCVIVFIFDELLRCSFVHYNCELLLVLTLFSFFIAIYWLVKWTVFMLKDDYVKDDDTNKAKRNLVKRLLVSFTSVRNFWQILSHLVVTFILLYNIPNFISMQNAGKSHLFLFCGICYLPYFLIGLIHMYVQKKHTDERITMHYVYHFFYMLLLSIVIMFFVKLRMPDLMYIFPFNDSTYLFCLKCMIIGTILCVGLVCPFLCTLVKYNMVYVRAFFKMLSIKVQRLRKLNSLQIEFMELAQKIKC